MRQTLAQGVLITSLWIGVVGSALAVVVLTYKTRLATQELEMLRHAAADLHVESGQLLLEKSSLSAYARVEKNAIENLNMTVPSIEEMVIVKP